MKKLAIIHILVTFGIIAFLIFTFFHSDTPIPSNTSTRALQTGSQVYNQVYNATDTALDVNLKARTGTGRSLVFLTGDAILNKVYNTTNTALDVSVQDLGTLAYPDAFTNMSSASLTNKDIMRYDSSSGFWKNYNSAAWDAATTPIPTVTPAPTATPIPAVPTPTPAPTATPIPAVPTATPQPTPTANPLVATALQQNGSVPLNNNTFLTGKDLAGTGLVNLFKVSGDQIVTGDDLVIDGLQLGQNTSKLTVFGGYSSIQTGSQVLLPSGTGYVRVICGDADQVGEVNFKADGSVTLSAAWATYTSFSITDEALHCCVIDAGTQPAIKNNLGFSSNISWFGTYR